MLKATSRILQKKLEEYKIPSDLDFIIVQHLMNDTCQFIQLLLKAGIRVSAVVGIPYSLKPSVVKELENNGVNVLRPDIDKIADVVLKLVTDAAKIGRRVIVHEVGGYCAPLAAKSLKFRKNCIGVVEETKQGLWRYQQVQSDLQKFPIVHFAESKLKVMEGEFVGRAVARSVDEDLAHLGRSIESSRIGVIGFGDIGAGVARSLRSRGAHVWCHDIRPIRLMQAVAQGFICVARDRILRECNAIVGATGKASFTDKHIKPLQNGILLCSASSRDLEFPIGAISTSAKHEKELISPNVTEYKLSNGKTLRISDNGYPVNFRSMSLPPSFGDLMFCLVTVGFFGLLQGKYKSGIMALNSEDEELIANEWWMSHCGESSPDGEWEFSI
jgi:adenosylhomocysteinase